MNTSISIRNRNIHCEFDLHIVRIYNDKELIALLKKDTEPATDELVAGIRAEYRKQFGVDFGVPYNSIAVEIWGHVYAEKMAEAIKHLSSIKLVDKMADKIIYHAERIDIGEHGHDNNRFVWDGLAHFKALIIPFLPTEKK